MRALGKILGLGFEVALYVVPAFIGVAVETVRFFGSIL